jgi:uncharacterized membrane protein SirB2
MPVYLPSAGSGCLLPTLIFLNLIFGWMIFKPVWLWLCVGVILVFIFILRASLFLKKFSSAGQKKRNDVVDIQAVVLDDETKAIKE